MNDEVVDFFAQNVTKSPVGGRALQASLVESGNLSIMTHVSNAVELGEEVMVSPLDYR